jgi:two-component system response regulator AtoC
VTDFGGGGVHEHRPVSVLVADDDVEVRDLFSDVLTDSGFEVSTAADGRSALDLMERSVYDVALFDIRMPYVDGLSLLAKSKRIGSPSHVIIVTGFGSPAVAAEATRLGAHDFINKPFDISEVEKVISRVVQTDLHASQAGLLLERGPEEEIFHGIVSRDPKMRHISEVIKKVARSKCTVLIHGESGTGKELVARAIHASSGAAGKPFMPIDCASINENLIESELFGHEKGAFTGAHVEKQGLFRVASGGTIFLDEISEIPVEVQAKLLRSLQDGKIRPIGSTRFYDVDVRVIAATNKDLRSAIKKETFRKDLFFRINVVPIEVPPLRVRKDDIPLLVGHFIKKFQRSDGPVKGASQDAMELLLRSDWPGNVRELENVIQRALALGETAIITKDDLPPLWVNETESKSEVGEGFRHRTLAEIEREAIEHALEETGGDKAAAASILGINKSTLYRKLKTFYPT